MPTFAPEDESGLVVGNGGLGALFQDGGDHASFGFLTFAVEVVELLGDGLGAVRRGGEEEVYDVAGVSHAAGGVDAGADLEADLASGGRLAGRNARDIEQGAEAGIGGAIEAEKSVMDEDAVFAAKGNDVGDGGDGGELHERIEHFALALGRHRGGEKESFGELEGNTCTAEVLIGVRAAGLIGIDDSDGGRDFGFGEVMVRDDDVDAEGAGMLDDGTGADSGIDTDDEGDAAGLGFGDDFGAHAVAFAEAVGHVEFALAAGDLDGFGEEDDRHGAVDVVVAVEEDLFPILDGEGEAGDGAGEAEQLGAGVELAEVGMEEGLGGGGVSVAAPDEYLGDGRAQSQFLLEPLNLGRIGRAPKPEGGPPGGSGDGLRRQTLVPRVEAAEVGAVLKARFGTGGHNVVHQVHGFVEPFGVKFKEIGAAFVIEGEFDGAGEAGVDAEFLEPGFVFAALVTGDGAFFQLFEGFFDHILAETAEGKDDQLDANALGDLEEDVIVGLVLDIPADDFEVVVEDTGGTVESDEVVLREILFNFEFQGFEVGFHSVFDFVGPASGRSVITRMSYWAPRSRAEGVRIVRGPM